MKKVEFPIGATRKSMMYWFLVVQAIAFVFLLLITWVDEELIIPEFFSKLFNLTPKTLASILESIWITVMFGFTIRYQLNSWKRIKLLEGIIPICSFCKKIRDDKNKWIQVEEYISEHSEADFSHSLCPSCGEKNYGELYRKAADGH